MNKKDIARYIEYSRLESTLTKEDVVKMCDDANKLGLYSICVNPKYVEFAREVLNELDSKVKLTSVVGYPLGETMQEIKAMEAVMLKESGVDELNVVLSTSAIITGYYDYVHEEVKRIVDCTEIPVKAVIDIALLNEEQLVKTCEACIEAGVKYIQTGIGNVDIIPESVKGVADIVAGICEVCAIGNINSIDKFYDIVCAGATKISTNQPISIVEEFSKKKNS